MTSFTVQRKKILSTRSRTIITTTIFFTAKFWLFIKKCVFGKNRTTTNKQLLSMLKKTWEKSFNGQKLFFCHFFTFWAKKRQNSFTKITFFCFKITSFWHFCSGVDINFGNLDFLQQKSFITSITGKRIICKLWLSPLSRNV